MLSNNTDSRVDHATSDTMAFLKKQEQALQADSHFKDGKELLLVKGYKDAIKAFSHALKSHPGHQDAKFYRAISYLDSGNPQKCSVELQELIDENPTYNRTSYVVLSISYRRMG